MVSIKKKICFYAEDDIMRWYEDLEPNTGSITLNKVLREYIRSKSHFLSEKERLEKLEKRMSSLEKQLRKK